MNLLAFRNLFRDKVRLTLTLVGIVFAVVLITVQIGLFLGFAETTSGIIDHDALPGPVYVVRITGREIGTGDLKVDGGLPKRLVLGMADPARSFFVPRLQTVLLFQQAIFQKENPVLPLKHQIPLFHPRLLIVD